MVSRVSGWEKMYQSRLLSWPVYLWYNSGGFVPSYGVASVLRYQRVTMSTPSGLSDGTRMKIVSFRTARNRGVSCVRMLYANSTAVWVDAISVAWIDAVIRTTVLPSAISRSASAGVVLRGS